MPTPFTVDIHDLGRVAGARRTLTRTFDAPNRIGTPVLGVEAGEPVTLELALECVSDGILVTGTAAASVTGECVRCLDPVQEDVLADIMALYTYPGVETAEDDDALQIEEEHIDLEPAVVDAIVSSLPFSPLCTADCAGLCATCGVRLAEAEGHAHDDVDPRWSALADLLNDLKES